MGLGGSIAAEKGKTDRMAGIQRRKQEEPYTIEIVGAPRIHWAHDLYHLMLRMPWWIDLLALSAAFLVLNVFFALAYVWTDGVANAHGFWDLYFFSVQTMGTIGYGAMYPQGLGAHVIVTIEALVQLFLLAVATGLVFAKFSVPRAMVEFALHATVGVYDGVPTLQIRIGNQRSSRLMEATVRVVALKSELTREGDKVYRMYDLPLVRDRSPALMRSWTVLHVIDDKSMLYGATPESMDKDEIEIIVTLAGVDETSAQAHYAQKRYYVTDLKWGARHADMISDRDDGGIRVDMTRFHHIVPTKRTADFPYGLE